MENELIRRSDVYAMLREIQGADCADEFTRGWEACSEHAQSELLKIQTVGLCNKN